LDVKKVDNYIKVVDLELGIDAVVRNGSISGKGSRKYKDDIQNAVSGYVIEEISKDMNTVANYKDDNSTVTYSEYALTASSFSSIWNGTSEQLYNIVSKSDLDKWLQEPVRYNKQLRNLSMYWYGLKGMIARTYELYKNIHSLDSSLKISNPLKENKAESLAKIVKFDKGINKKSLIRDIIFQTVAEGTCIGYIHGMASNRYIQLLNLNYYIPKKIVNGVWQVEVDLLKFATGYAESLREYPIDYVFDAKDLNPKSELLDQPDEVQRAYKRLEMSRSITERNYLLNIDKTFVIKIMSKQSERLGRPAGTPSFADIIHKELIRDAEIALIDRVINMMLVVKMGEAGKEGFKPDKDLRRELATEIRKALQNQTLKGLKTIGIPYWAEIEALKTDLSLFDKEKYENIDNDIAVSLGISGLFGGSIDSSYSGGQLMTNLFVTNVYSILEQIEENVFNYQYNLLAPEATITIKREFNRNLVLDEKTKIEIIKGLVDKGGAVKPLLDAIGIDFETYIDQVKYEKDELEINDVFEPFQTSFTMSNDDEVGRPRTDDSGNNDEGNNTPRPSTE
jgi:hypothetical protein